MSATATVESRILDELTKISKRQDTIEDRIKTAEGRRVTGAVVAAGTPYAPGRSPFVRKGEDIFSSRGFSFGRMMNAFDTKSDIERQNCKIELEFCDRFTNEMKKTGWRPAARDSILAPLWPEGFESGTISDSMYYEMKGLLEFGVAGLTPETFEQEVIQMKGAVTAGSPAQSWLDQTLGGSFVPPPTFGPPIELLRNAEALMNAGATVIPLGPSGRIVMPRLTAATTGGFAGENAAQTPVTAGTGSMELTAKKVISVVVMPNEFLRFSTPAAEQIIRNDIFKTVALIFDYNLLQGVGSSNTPLGLVTMGTAGAPSPSAGSYTASSYGINVIGPAASNQLAGQDFETFLAAIEENNGDASRCAWIMRPLMFRAIRKARWTPYSGGTSQGGFLFDLTRSYRDGENNQQKLELLDCKVVVTPQVSNTRGTNQTYVLCLDAPDYLVALFGAIEFTQTDAGLNLLGSDQTAVRAILTGDGGPRHPGLVSFADALNLSVSG